MSDYPRTPRQEELVLRVRPLAQEFADRAARYDHTGQFPFENFDALRRAGLPALSVPAEAGGWGADLVECCMVIEEIARGDASTALAFAMHVQTIGHAAESGSWPADLFGRVCREAVDQGALINSVASEPELGSPSRGGRPKTTAAPERSPDGEVTSWRLEGYKTFASMSPALAYMIIPAALDDGSGDTARFLVSTGPGVEIVETWDSMGMRATGSHDVRLHDVCVPAAAMISRGAEGPSGRGSATNAWFMLLVGAVYLGVAQAAIDAAARYAWERVPTALGKPIAEVESIQRQIGEGAYLVQQARLALHHAAWLWASCAEDRAALGTLVGVAKVTATNNAIGAADHAMRVAGGASLSRSLPLERHYRDVRAGLNHPITDDAAYLQLGRLALAGFQP